MQAYFRYKFYSAVPSTNEVSFFGWVCSQVCPVLWLTSALYLIFPLVTFLSNFKNKQKNWLGAMAQSVNSNIRLGKRLPLDPALPEISTSWLAGHGFLLCKLAAASSLCEGNSLRTRNLLLVVEICLPNRILQQLED